LTIGRRGGPGTRRRRERGLFSFVEVLLASLVLALSATATAYWVETVNSLSTDADEQTIAGSVLKIAEGVIGSKAFREKGTTTIGPESGETLATYDDIDDFHGLVSSPPFDGALQSQTPLAGWSTTVTVRGVDVMTGQASTTSPLRIVTVSVTRNGKEVAKTAWLRARSPFE